MTFADRVYHLNDRYDHLPPEWRLQVVVWPLLALGAINMILTLAAGFPFGLLLLIGIACVAVARVLYVMGELEPSAGHPKEQAPRRREMEAPEWLLYLNRSYDELPEHQRFWVVPIVLVVVGALNMLLTLGTGFAFGLLFLLALLAIIAIRAPYARGWFRLPEPVARPVQAVSYTPAALEAPAVAISPQERSTDPAALRAQTGAISPQERSTGPVVAGAMVYGASSWVSDVEPETPEQPRPSPAAASPPAPEPQPASSRVRILRPRLSQDAGPPGEQGPEVRADEPPSPLHGQEDSI